MSSSAVLPPSPMQGTDGRSIFPTFPWLLWQLPSSLALLPGPCSAEPRVSLSFTNTHRAVNVMSVCVSIRTEKCLREEQRDYQKELSFSAFHPAWCERTPPTGCRSRSAGESGGEGRGEGWLGGNVRNYLVWSFWDFFICCCRIWGTTTRYKGEWII